MNSLSWFIYFAGVVSDVKFVLVLFSILGGTVLGVISVVFAAEHGDFSKFKFLTIPLHTVLLTAAIPGRETMYAIAASEMGEKLLKTETAGKVQQALNAWLDAQVKQISKGN